MRLPLRVSVVAFLALPFVLPCTARAAAEEGAMQHGAPTVSAGTAPLFDGLGKYHRTISTKSPLAQRYFDQGMNFMWGFNLNEAQRSFEECAKVDPACAMCEWGAALSLGPHYNVPALPPRTVAANVHAQKALTLLAGATPVERDLVEAVVKRYADPPPANPDDQKKLDTAYAEAMKALMEKYPNDDDVAALWCEAMMDLRPWDLWTSDEKPQPGTPELIATLEKILARNPDHPGANHYYIHVIEPSPHPEKAVAAADRLKKLDSVVGHLTHMPSHIYHLVGRYDDARVANARALEKDKAYEASAKSVQPESFYPMYTAHNAQFLSWTAMSQGRSADAFRYAKESVTKMPPEMFQMMPGFDIFLTTPILAYARFGKWDDVLAEPAPVTHFRTWRGSGTTRAASLSRAKARRPLRPQRSTACAPSPRPFRRRRPRPTTRRSSSSPSRRRRWRAGLHSSRGGPMKGSSGSRRRCARRTDPLRRAERLALSGAPHAGRSLAQGRPRLRGRARVPGRSRAQQGERLGAPWSRREPAQAGEEGRRRIGAEALRQGVGRSRRQDHGVELLTALMGAAREGPSLDDMMPEHAELTELAARLDAIHDVWTRHLAKLERHRRATGITSLRPLRRSENATTLMSTRPHAIAAARIMSSVMCF
jgi:tetratricopeptide (TPR) repeat protein